MEKDDKLTVYYQMLVNAFESSTADFIFNKDRAHNATIMRFMFDRSKQVSMYCGKMSVFREGFYEKIKASATDDTEKKELEILSDEAKVKLLESMKSFFSQDDSQLTIILENYDSDYLNDLIDTDLIMTNIKRKKLRLYMLGDNLTFKRRIAHFSFSDTPIVRFEQSKEEHSAICTINDSKLRELTVTTFENLLKFAVPVECNRS